MLLTSRSVVRLRCTKLYCWCVSMCSHALTCAHMGSFTLEIWISCESKPDENIENIPSQFDQRKRRRRRQGCRCPASSYNSVIKDSGKPHFDRLWAQAKYSGRVQRGWDKSKSSNSLWELEIRTRKRVARKVSKASFGHNFWSRRS